jgi:hypothetical protein
VLARGGGGRALRGSAGTAERGEAGCGGCLAFAAAAAPARGLSVVYTAQEERIGGICNSISQSSSSSSD